MIMFALIGPQKKDLDPDPDSTFKKDRQSDRDPDLSIMDRKIIMPYHILVCYINFVSLKKFTNHNIIISKISI